MIDWDDMVLRPTMSAFGEFVRYAPAVGIAFEIPDAVFDAGFVEVDPIGEQGVMSAKPTLGVRTSAFPAGWDAKEAQGDRFTVVRTGVTYVVKDGQPDSHGHAVLHANLAQSQVPVTV